jgi:hypothetical protein
LIGLHKNPNEILMKNIEQDDRILRALANNSKHLHKNPDYCIAKFPCIHPIVLGKSYCPHCIWNMDYLKTLTL